MRNILCFSFLVVLLVVAVSSRGYAQIPNAGFESWTGGNPDSWSASNSPIWTTIIQSTDAHSGSSAVGGIVDLYATVAIPPTLVSGTSGRGVPVNARPGALHGWYKFAPVGGDLLLISIALSKGGHGMGAGTKVVTAAQTTYKEFVANIEYATAEVPDTCYISITIANGNGFASAGSTFVIDDLAFGVASAVEASGNVVPAVYVLSQNYPNPFNPSTLIQYSIPRSGRIRLTVFDILGREIASLVDAVQAAGIHKARFDGSSLSSGTYFYRLQAGDFVQSRKLLIMK